MVTVLRAILTPGEKMMVEDGRWESVLLSRILWQDATDEAFRESVARLVKRPVLTAISGFELRNDMATEVFVLAPEGSAAGDARRG